MEIDRRSFLKLMATTASVGVIQQLGGVIKPAFSEETILRTHPLKIYSPTEFKKLKICFHDPVDPNGLWGRGLFFTNVMKDLYAGMSKHGHNLSWGKFNIPTDADLTIVAGWIQSDLIASCQKRGRNILIIEQGNIQPRLNWPSLGFNGLIGYAHYASTPNSSDRFNKYFGHHLKEWQVRNNNSALLIGQKPKDLSLHGLDINEWLQDVANNLLTREIKVIYRPHPVVVAEAKASNRMFFVPKGTMLSKGSLSDDLSRVDFSVIYSSTTAVESVLAGVPAVVFSQGCAAWGVSSRSLDDPLNYCDRSLWCNDLAWRQWSFTELKNGDAWEHTQKAIVG